MEDGKVTCLLTHHARKAGSMNSRRMNNKESGKNKEKKTTKKIVDEVNKAIATRQKHGTTRSAATIASAIG